MLAASFLGENRRCSETAAGQGIGISRVRDARLELATARSISSRRGEKQRRFAATRLPQYLVVSRCFLANYERNQPLASATQRVVHQ